LFAVFLAVSLITICVVNCANLGKTLTVEQTDTEGMEILMVVAPHESYCPCNGIWEHCCDNPDNYPDYDNADVSSIASYYPDYDYPDYDEIMMNFDDDDAGTFNPYGVPVTGLLG
jgi:hypothetical protein